MFPPAPLRSALDRHVPDWGRIPWHKQKGGRTNLVWKVGNHIVKLYREDQQTPLFANSAQNESLALELLSESRIPPKLTSAGGDWLIYEFVPGEPWQTGVEQIACLLGLLHSNAFAKRAPLPQFEPQMDFAVATTALLQQAALSDTYALPEKDVSRLSLVHGDPVPANIIASKQGLTLIDWQCANIGDPAADLAIFLSPAMQLVYRGKPLTMMEMDQFLSAYPGKAVVRHYHKYRHMHHLRIAAHCILRARRGDRGYDDAARAELAFARSLAP